MNFSEIKRILKSDKRKIYGTLDVNCFCMFFIAKCS